MKGDVIWDSISQLDSYMKDNSTLTGKITDDETYAGNGGSGYCNVYIEKGSIWTVIGDSTVTELYNAGTIKCTDGKVCVKGTGKYTITVSKYSTKADMSGASSATNWSDYQVPNPSELD